MGSHVATAWFWFGLAILSTLNAHSGYHLPFFPSPEAHDFHHLKYACYVNFYQIIIINYLKTAYRFNNCFGVLGIMDRLHGTDIMFRQTQAYPRHILMLSLVPPREVFPDAQQKEM